MTLCGGTEKSYTKKVVFLKLIENCKTAVLNLFGTEPPLSDDFPLHAPYIYK